MESGREQPLLARACRITLIIDNNFDTFVPLPVLDELQQHDMTDFLDTRTIDTCVLKVGNNSFSLVCI